MESDQNLFCQAWTGSKLFATVSYLWTKVTNNRVGGGCVCVCGIPQILPSVSFKKQNQYGHLGM